MKIASWNELRPIKPVYHEYILPWDRLKPLILAWKPHLDRLSPCWILILILAILSLQKMLHFLQLCSLAWALRYKFAPQSLRISNLALWTHVTVTSLPQASCYAFASQLICSFGLCATYLFHSCFDPSLMDFKLLRL